MKSFFVYSYIVICCYVSFAQSDFPKLNNEELPGCKILHEDYYDGNSLWGYMDGGADVYLEYGFKKLLSQEIELDKVKYKTDIYRMSDVESAYGIFSILNFKCIIDSAICRFNCNSRYQLQCAFNNYYISIINDKGNPEAGREAKLIAIKILSKIDTTQMDLPELFNAEPISKHLQNAKFIKGKLGIQNGFPQWEDLFSDAISYSFFVAQTGIELKQTNIAVIKFTTSNELKLFYEKLKFEYTGNKIYQSKIINGKFTGIWKYKKNSIILIESAASTDKLKKIIEAVNLYIKN